MEISIQHNSVEKKFFCVLGEKEAVLEYEITGKNELNFYHTYVPPEYRDQGIANEILSFAVNYAKSNGFKVNASCSYAYRYFMSHKDLEDIWIK